MQMIHLCFSVSDAEIKSDGCCVSAIYYIWYYYCKFYYIWSWTSTIPFRWMLGTWMTIPACIRRLVTIFGKTLAEISLWLQAYFAFSFSISVSVKNYHCLAYVTLVLSKMEDFLCLSGCQKSVWECELIKGGVISML